MAVALNVADQTGTYDAALTLLAKVIRSSRIKPMLVGGAAVEFWTGGTGLRHHLREIDVVLPVQLNGNTVYGSTDPAKHGNPFATPFHAEAEALVSRLGDLCAAPTVYVSSYKVHFEHTSVALDLVAPSVTGSFTFQPGMSDLQNLTVSGFTGRSLRARIAAPLTLIMGKVSQPRINSAADQTMAMFGEEDKGVRDVVDIVALLQSATVEQTTRWLETGVRRARRPTSATVPSAPRGPEPFERLTMILSEPAVVKNVADFAAAHPELTFNVDARALREAAEQSSELNRQFIERRAELRSLEASVTADDGLGAVI